MGIENTTKRPPELHLLGAESEGTSGYIEGMEAAGQRQLVNSDVLPTDRRGDFEALGFAFGDVVKGDDMFQHATLPDGWKREGSDHAMWSYIHDERGIERVAIFYKAAFYDRSAHANVTDVGRSVAAALCYSDTPIPWDLLTDDERTRALESLRDYAEKNPEHYQDVPEKARAELDRLVHKDSSGAL